MYKLVTDALLINIFVTVVFVNNELFDNNDVVFRYVILALEIVELLLYKFDIDAFNIIELLELNKLAYSVCFTVAPPKIVNAPPFENPVASVVFCIEIPPKDINDPTEELILEVELKIVIIPPKLTLLFILTPPLI